MQFLAVLFFVGSNAAAQNQKIDSLRHLLSIGNNERNFEIVFGLAYELFDVNNEQALEYGYRSFDIAKKSGDSLKIIRSGRITGQLLRRLDKLNESISVFSDVLPIARRNKIINEEKSILNALAIAFTFIANYDKALECHFQSLLIREQEGNKLEIIISLNNIGIVYFKLRNYSQALEYFNRALKLTEEAKIVYDLDRLLINLGLCHNQLNNFTEAQKYINRGLSSCGSNCQDQVKIEAHFGLGVSNLGQENWDESLHHFEESLRLSRLTDNKRFQAENLVNLSRIYVIKQQINRAEEVLKEAEALASSSGYKELLIDIYRQFSTLYGQINNFEKVAIYQSRYIAIKDSVYSESLIKNLTKVQTDFAERENIKTIASKEVIIQQQRSLNIAIAVIAVLAVLLVLVLYRSIRITKRVNAELSDAKETIEEQNKLLEIKNKDLDREVEKKTIDLERVNISLKQVNEELDNFIYKTSHDIRGPLASLKGMCNVALMDVKDAVALDYLRKLDTTAERLNSILTRLLIINQINNSKLLVAKIDFPAIVNEVIKLEKKKGLPQKIRLINKIEKEAVIYSDKELVRIVLENLIDNAIKFYNDSERVDSFVEVNIVKNGDDGVKVSVIDNGIGISESNPGKLFQMFFRASERSEIGGIGLYIVKTATQKLGGKVGLLTTPEGHTEFYVLFPESPPQTESINMKEARITAFT